MGLKKLGDGIPGWEFDIKPLENKLRIIIGLCQNRAETFEKIRDEHEAILKKSVGEITETFPPSDIGWPPSTNVREEINKRYNAIEGCINAQIRQLQNELLEEIGRLKQELNSQIDGLRKLVPEI